MGVVGPGGGRVGKIRADVEYECQMHIAEYPEIKCAPERYCNADQMPGIQK